MNSAIGRLIDNISNPDMLVVPRGGAAGNGALASSKLDRWKFDYPSVPFRQVLLSPLIPRTVLVICGTVPKNAKRFHINFIIDTGKGSNIAFHLNPRFDEGYLVSNSLFNEKWEEQIAERPNPFKKGAEFSLEIFITLNEYLVSVNRNHVSKFGHRIAFNEVNRIDVVGDVQLVTAELTMKDFYPPSAVSNNIYIHDKLRVPYSRAFIDNVVPSTIVNIRGVVPDKAVRFSINFCTDWSANCDIAFHFNPRFDQQYVACNSYHGGKWATEMAEGYGKYLFPRGHAFFIDIYTTHSYFVVYVNGVHFCKFQYRMSLNRIKRLEVVGDVVLKWVNIMSNLSPDEFEIVESHCVVFDNV